MAAENICADVRLDDFTVELKPEDIPGASVNDKDIGIAPLFKSRLCPVKLCLKSDGKKCAEQQNLFAMFLKVASPLRILTSHFFFK
jgi:hypothetical protein